MTCYNIRSVNIGLLSVITGQRSVLAWQRSIQIGQRSTNAWQRSVKYRQRSKLFHSALFCLCKIYFYEKLKGTVSYATCPTRLFSIKFIFFNLIQKLYIGKSHTFVHTLFKQRSSFSALSNLPSSSSLLTSSSMSGLKRQTDSSTSERGKKSKVDTEHLDCRF